MAPKYTNRVGKTWKETLAQYQRQAVLNQIEKIVMELEDEKDAPEQLAARDLTVDKVVKIFGLKEEFQLWELRKGGGDVPESLTFVLGLINDAPFDKNSEAYSRLTIDHLIMACFAKHKKNFSKQSELSTNDPTTTTSPILEQSELSTNDPTTTTSPILEQSELSTNDPTTTTSPILEQSELPTTPSKTPESTSQPLLIKVFHKMPLAVQVERGSKKCVVSGIADWAIGYGDRAVLEDGTVLLAVNAKRRELSSTDEGPLLAYLASIRQLRIQANKENVMTQGFYSDGENYRFICIRNDGTVMRSRWYDLLFKRELKSVFNFLLSMLKTAADSSPNTSLIELGKERDVFVRVIEDHEIYDDFDIAEEDESCRLWITEVA